MTVFEDLLDVARRSSIQVRSTQRGEDAIQAGHVGVVLSGSVAFLAPDGERLAVLVGRGDVLGLEALGGRAPPLRGVWMSAGRVVELPAATLVETAAAGRLLDWLSEGSARMQRALATEIACRLDHGVTVRLARLLAALGDDAPAATIATTQLEIARLLGVQRTSICAGVDALKRRGLIEVRRGRISVRDLPGLQAAAQG